MSARKKPAGSTQVERDRIALGRIESYMDGVIKNQLQCPTCRKDMEIKELPASAVQLLRSRYDKLRPSLQAVEQTIVDPRDSQDAGQLTAKLAALFTEKPQLLEQIRELMRGAHATNAPHNATSDGNGVSQERITH